MIDGPPATREGASPLDGFRVVDLTRLVPGAFATLMLAELGAEVIKVEDPRGGDPMRTLPPLLDGRGLYHLLLDRGKKSVALDLRDPADLAVLDRMLATADVMTSQVASPGVAGSRLPSRMAVTGRQNMSWCLLSKDAMYASASARCTWARSRASFHASSRRWPPMTRAASFHPGVELPTQKNPMSAWSGVRFAEVTPP